MTELYVIVRAGDGEPLWASVTTQEEAEGVAMRAAVNTGMVNLLSGADLAEHLTWSSGGVSLSRNQLTAWTGRELTVDELAELDEAVPHSSIPEAIGQISDYLPSKPDMEEGD